MADDEGIIDVYRISGSDRYQYAPCLSQEPCCEEKKRPAQEEGEYLDETIEEGVSQVRRRYQYRGIIFL